MSIPNRNRQWLINDRPTGRPLKEGDFKLVEEEVRQPEKGELLLKTLYLGFDPAQKGWMENVADYVAPTQIGEVMRGSAVLEVVASEHPKFKVGDVVSGLTGWQEYTTVPVASVQRIQNPKYKTENLGVLGTPGMTAYFGFIHIGKPKPGDTVVVSGAAGATGSVVGQIAKIMGCRVIGIAGGKEKCDWLIKEAGYDAAIDYKAHDSIRQPLKELVPNGIDVFYDNVGGTILNDCLGEIATGARVVICGGISRYETGVLPAGPENYFNIVFRRASMEGFIVLDYAAQFGEARRRMIEWIEDGKLSYQEDIQEGFENAPDTLQRLFSGQNYGKQLLKI